MRATAFHSKLVFFRQSPSLRQACICLLQNAKTTMGDTNHGEVAVRAQRGQVDRDR